MTVTKFSILIFCLCPFVTLTGQNVDRANDLYKNGGFAEAIPIYEAALAKKPNSMLLKVKLANCHRILSHPAQAARLFADIVESKEAKPIDFMHFGETLMMLEKYDSAKILFRKFTDLKPDDERGLLLLRNVDKVKTLRPLFGGVTVFPFLHNADADDNAPVWSPYGIVFASDRPSPFKLLKEKNPATGRDYTNIYLAERVNDSTFNAPKEFSSKLSELNRNTSNATFTADGQRVYFCQNSNTPSKSGAYNMQIFTAETTDKTGLTWKSIEPMPFCTPENNYMYPSVSPDGKRLFLVAQRGDGLGGLDLYVASKTKKGWSRLENLGNKVNTAAHEGFPFAASDGKLYFCSKGHAGYGGYDIFVTEQDTATGEWRAPKNIGLPFNSPYDDISICFDATNLHGAFTSTRGGRGDDLFLFSIDLALAARQRAELAAANAKLKASQSMVSVPKSEQKTIVKAAEMPQNAVASTPKLEQKTENKAAETTQMPEIPMPQTLEKPRMQTVEVAQKTGISTTEGKLNDATEGHANVVSEKPTAKTGSSVSTPSKHEIDPKSAYLKELQKMVESGNLPENRIFVIENINYGHNASTDITPDLALALDRVAEFLTKNRKLTVEIGEHTEALGLDDSRAKQISTARANSVVKYLEAQGVNAKRITAQGFGRSRPVKECRNGGCTPEEDEKNRRVDIKINGIL
jgi:outer membrane protein OmpA-like peptidoglycan-associated protein